MVDDFGRYLSGEKLYGDDFAAGEIDQWFADEAEGYAGLGAGDKNRYSYSYHELNHAHAFRFLKERRFENVLGIGSAYGDEFRPIAKNIRKITILDPSDAFSETGEIMGIPCTFRKPNSSGDIDFDDEHFDLISSLGVMHHIPNVTHVLNECYRCLATNGVMLLREPISSMGDWRKPRTGLTKHERGIPLPILDRIIGDAGFSVIRKAFCNFPMLPKIAGRLGIATYNSSMFTMTDSILSQLFSGNVRYHRTTFLEKLAPASIYLLLTK
jgi:SAM-dependent methyltransferase